MRCFACHLKIKPASICLTFPQRAKVFLGCPSTRTETKFADRRQECSASGRTQAHRESTQTRRFLSVACAAASTGAAKLLVPQRLLGSFQCQMTQCSQLSAGIKMAGKPAQQQEGLKMPSGDIFPWIGFGTSGIPSPDSIRLLAQCLQALSCNAKPFEAQVLSA